MRTDECREWRERIGALVLGQLPDDERFAVEAHLEGCATCRAEAEALAPVASLLTRVDPERLAPAPEPPADLGDRIAHRIAAERRSRRRKRTRLRIGLATAGAAAAAAVVLILALDDPSPSPTPSQTVAFHSLPRGAWGEAALTPHAWGSEIGIQVRGFKRGTPCWVWLRNEHGKRVPAGSFRYAYTGGSQYAGLSAALKPDEATAIGLQVGSKTYVTPLPSRQPRTTGGTN